MYESVPWSVLCPQIKGSWRQGEHVALVGPTGVGKTTLLAEILPARRYVVVFVTKIKDDTIAQDFKGWDIIHEWPPRAHHEKVLLQPKPGKTIRETKANQVRVFRKALNAIFQDLNWCVVWDEQHYMSTELGLSEEQAMYMHQGRSMGLSVVAGTQRPAAVPVVTYSACTHAFVWKTTFDDDLKRLANLGGIDRKTFAAEMLTLSKHEFLYVNTRKGLVYRSQVK